MFDIRDHGGTFKGITNTLKAGDNTFLSDTNTYYNDKTGTYTQVGKTLIVNLTGNIRVKIGGKGDGGSYPVYIQIRVNNVVMKSFNILPYTLTYVTNDLQVKKGDAITIYATNFSGGSAGTSVGPFYFNVETLPFTYS